MSHVTVAHAVQMRIFIIKILTGVGSVLFAMLLVEWAIRQFAPLYLADIPASLEYDKELGYRLRQNIQLFRTTDYQQETKTNPLGTSNFQESFEGYQRLVFAIGDSTTEGIGVPADASYPFQLDLDLNTDANGMYQKRYGIVNLGVEGYGALQEITVLERSAAKIGKPSIILYMGCDNDYEDDLLLQSGYRASSLVPGNPRWGIWEPMLQWLTNDVQLGLRAKILLGVVRRQHLSGTSELSDKRHSTAELEAPRVDRFAADASKYGSLLVVTWSNPGQSYDWLKIWAQRKGIAFADWQPKAKSLREVMPALSMENQHSGDHYRTWVNRMIADEFARQIHEQGQ